MWVFPLACRAAAHPQLLPAWQRPSGIKVVAAAAAAASPTPPSVLALAPPCIHYQQQLQQLQHHCRYHHVSHHHHHHKHKHKHQQHSYMQTRLPHRVGAAAAAQHRVHATCTQLHKRHLVSASSPTTTAAAAATAIEDDDDSDSGSSDDAPPLGAAGLRALETLGSHGIKASRAIGYDAVLQLLEVGARQQVPGLHHTAMEVLREMQASEFADDTAKVNTRAYNCVIVTVGLSASSLATARAAVEAVWGLVKEMAATGGAVAPNLTTYGLVLQTCDDAATFGTSVAAAVATNALVVMKKLGGSVAPRIEHYNELLSVYSRLAVGDTSGEYARKAIDLLRGMTASGAVAPKLRSYHLVLRCCEHAAASDVEWAPDEAVRHLRMVLDPASGLKPESKTYGMAMNACASSMNFENASSRLEQGLGIVSMVLNDSSGTSHSMQTVNTALKLCARAAKHGAARGAVHAITLLRQAADSGFEPNVISYNNAITACANAIPLAHPEKYLEAAQRLLEEAKAKGEAAQPNVITYQATLEACAAASWAKVEHAATTAVRILEEAKELQFRKGILYSTTVRACGGSLFNAEPGALQRLLDLMKEGRDLMATHTPYSAAIRAIVNSVHTGGLPVLQEGLKLLYQQREKLDGSDLPDLLTYNAVLRACSIVAQNGDAGAAPIALGLFEYLQAQGGDLKPNMRTYRHTVLSCLYSAKRDAQLLETGAQLMQRRKSLRARSPELAVAFVEAFQAVSVDKEKLAKCPTAVAIAARLGVTASSANSTSAGKGAGKKKAKFNAQDRGHKPRPKDSKGEGRGKEHRELRRGPTTTKAG